MNEKGSKPEYGSPEFLSLISSVTVATSPSLIGCLETSVIVISFCVMKCSAISLKFSNSRINFLFTESCGITTGTVGMITGVVGTTTGVVGVVGCVGCVGCVGVTTGVVGVVHVFIVGTIIGSVGISVLLL